MATLSPRSKKPGRVRFADTETGDLMETGNVARANIKPLAELTVAVNKNATPPNKNSSNSAPPKVLRSPDRKAPPTVNLLMAVAQRNYMPMLRQTKMVYDQLLRDKQARLLSDVYKVKDEYEHQCRHLEWGTSKEQALEYGVRAQAHLQELQVRAEGELNALHEDYQQKINKMIRALEEKWCQDKASAQKPVKK